MIENISIDEELLPTEEDVRHYEKHGWFVTPQLFDEDIIDQAKLAIRRHQEGERDHKISSKARFTDWRPGDGYTVRNNEFFSVQSDAAKPLCRHPLIGAIAARLARTPAVRLFDDQAVCKPSKDESNKTVVGWHTDHSYWSTCTSTKMLTAWVPLQDTNSDSGTLMVIDGSHRWPESEHIRHFNDPDLDSLSARINRDIPEESYISIYLKKGQISFHHMRLLHASGPNRSNVDRLALAIHLQDEGNSYRKAFSNGNLIVIPHDEICRRQSDGAPDYSDPEVFPTIWREAEHAG